MNLTKEECLEALHSIAVTDTYLVYSNGDDVAKELKIIRELIDEHFELVEKYDKLKRENLGLKQTVKNLKEKEAKRYSDIMGSKFI